VTERVEAHRAVSSWALGEGLATYHRIVLSGNDGYLHETVAVLRSDFPVS
jgi:hypothetical protein